MRVIPPLAITDGMLTSSTCAEPHATEQDYNAATAYAIGDKVILGSPTSAVTITIAAPAVVSWATHGQADGTPVVFTTDGALPTGLTAGQVYYVLNAAAGTFQVAETPDGAPIITTGSQSGTHTAKTQVHRLFESLVGSNTGNYPTLEASADKWSDIGPSNRWAMFDLLRNTGTTQASPLTVVLTPGVRVDSLALVGLIADSVTVAVTVSAVEVYSETIDLNTRNVLNWYDHFFAPFTFRTALALFDLPPYTNGVITVTMTRAAGAVTCGGIVLGLNTFIGITLSQAVSSALNFSRIERDDFGNVTLVPRRSVPKATLQVLTAKANVNAVRAVRDALSGMPALWSGLDDAEDGYFEAVLFLGIHKTFDVAMDQPAPDWATTSLELEEV